MTALIGYLRSHRIAECFAVGAGAGLFSWFFRDLNKLGFETWVHGPPYPVLVIAPLVVACAAVGALYEPFGELERSLTKRLWAYRLILIGLVTVASGAAISFALRAYPSDAGMAVRNLAAMTGTSALFAPVIGSRLAWMPTTVVYVAMYTASAGGTLVGARLPEVIWQWPLLPVDDMTSLFIATALAIGVPLICWLGPREPATLQE